MYISGAMMLHILPLIGRVQGIYHAKMTMCFQAVQDPPMQGPVVSPHCVVGSWWVLLCDKQQRATQTNKTQEQRKKIHKPFVKTAWWKGGACGLLLNLLARVFIFSQCCMHLAKLFNIVTTSGWWWTWEGVVPLTAISVVVRRVRCPALHIGWFMMWFVTHCVAIWWGNITRRYGSLGL